MKREDGELKHSELTYQIIGCAQRVHRELGPGFPGSVYHKALCLDLVAENIPFETEKTVEVYYRKACCGEFRLDLLIHKTVVVELKAVSQLNEEHLAQPLSYLKATGLDVALLINFGRKSLETKRVVL